MRADEPARHHAPEKPNHEADQHSNGAVRGDNAGVTVPPATTQTGKQVSTHRHGQSLVLRSVRHDPPDTHKLAQVLASLASAMAEETAGTTAEPATPGATASHDADGAAAPNDERG